MADRRREPDDGGGRAMQVRKAGEDEADVIRTIVDDAYSHYVERIGRRPGPMDDDYAARVRDGLVDVIEDDGEVLGLVVLIDEGDALLVENVAVRPSAQGRGVGRALLAHADSTAARLGRDELRLYTHSQMTENIALYTRLGWHETERRTERGFKRVFFSKPTDLSTP
jgi:ribosomal protein S18 acetylase RimI-like enzyme